MSIKISIVTIVRNDVTNIERTLRSIITQTSRDSVEYIVVDGASTDGTSQIISRYTDKIDHYICEPDTGIYNAMNKGLAMASGDYVMFINSGDSLSDSCTIERIIAEIGESRPAVGYGAYREVKGPKPVGDIIPSRHWSKIWYGPITSHQSMLYSLELIRDKVLRYDESYRIAADYKFTAEAIMAAEDNIIQMAICVSNFDISGVSSLNQNDGLREANRVRREVFGWGYVKITCLTIVLLSARYAKRYINPVYKFLRNR